jgi:hypothetical protein
MRWRRWVRRGFVISTLYAAGILEGYYIPRYYGIEWMLLAIGATAIFAGFWIRSRWDS